MKKTYDNIGLIKSIHGGFYQEYQWGSFKSSIAANLQHLLNQLIQCKKETIAKMNITFR